jgi:branched-chain amino acid transport system ATP-binding protein
VSTPARTEEIVLDVRGLRAGYGRSEVVRGIDLRLHRGECVGLIGPNGHGKTTLLSALSGRLGTLAGSIEFEGEDLTSRDASERAMRGLALVPEGDHLFGDLTVEENLLVPLSHSKARWQRRRSALADMVHRFPLIEPLLDRRARNLSGGEKRTVALARGLIAEPTLLMLDEPSLGLSPGMTAAVLSTITELHGAGLTVLMVEESPARLKQTVDRVCLLDDGRIVAQGTSHEVLDNERLLVTYLGQESGVATGG